MHYKKEAFDYIITYPKQRFIMDLAEFPNELKNNNNYLYLFNVIEHFSKYGLSYLLKNKEAKTKYKQLKNIQKAAAFLKKLVVIMVPILKII